MVDNPLFLTLVAAELIFILVRSESLYILVKSKEQLTDKEQHRIERGLFRCILLEAFAFVPVSACLLFMISPLMIPPRWFDGNSTNAVYSAMGVISYGFPFIAVKKIITRVALTTLSEFASLTSEE